MMPRTQEVLNNGTNSCAIFYVPGTVNVLLVTHVLKLWGTCWKSDLECGIISDISKEHDLKHFT